MKTDFNSTTAVWTPKTLLLRPGFQSETRHVPVMSPLSSIVTGGGGPRAPRPLASRPIPPNPGEATLIIAQATLLGPRIGCFRPGHSPVMNPKSILLLHQGFLSTQLTVFNSSSSLEFQGSSQEARNFTLGSPITCEGCPQVSRFGKRNHLLLTTAVIKLRHTITRIN